MKFLEIEYFSRQIGQSGPSNVLLTGHLGLLSWKCIFFFDGEISGSTEKGRNTRTSTFMLRGKNLMKKDLAQRSFPLLRDENRHQFSSRFWAYQTCPYLFPMFNLVFHPFPPFKNAFGLWFSRARLISSSLCFLANSNIRIEPMNVFVLQLMQVCWKAWNPRSNKPRFWWTISSGTIRSGPQKNSLHQRSQMDKKNFYCLTSNRVCSNK